MTKTTVPPEKRALYAQLIATHSEIELMGGDKLPYTALNGNMFSQMSKEGKLGLRMSAPDREAFMAAYDAVPFMNYGAVMREYVEVPDSLLQDTTALMSYLEKSYAYAQELKPKNSK